MRGGREVKEFLEKDLGKEGMKRAVIVLFHLGPIVHGAPQGSLCGHSRCRIFQDQGKQVLLLMDSVTRFGRALREIGLAAGEPPHSKGVPTFGLLEPAKTHGEGRELEQRIDNGLLYGPGRG